MNSEQRLYENTAQKPTHNANAGRYIRKAKRQTVKKVPLDPRVKYFYLLIKLKYSI